ncbi:efflux RND transporter periplasmic adaptor subunit [Varunaivibrio sulfuroxidans]|uniref:HlyD family secretion protein n=1 Tax=Varunaivibrio sulfuroxidans TaxID=1773489 RepID=A0A4R3J520_9PROT|nr:HlyD family efflux transporter periplasmic adaptor subunit [Varunaivibrio sulfuroxidans]TCS60362.1 HlyD family secretion protein [Varunaivibrio sulfuroxidans]WES30950.1 HlyD family efflux transporter periplasmic adaptor subunit [Varunaivibrio sulfuroxidans]
MATLPLKKISLFIVACAIAIALLVWGITPTPVPVDLIAVKRAPMDVTIDGEGHTRVRDVYAVSAPISGRLRRVKIRVGDAVRANRTVLATIEPASPQFLDARALARAQAAAKAAEAAQALARAELERVRAKLTFAKTNLRRARDLFAKHVISERQFDQAKLDVTIQGAAEDSARAALNVRTFELKTARAALIAPTDDPEGQTTCCVEVRAPVDGKVLRLLRQSEGFVERASPLFEIGDPTRMEVVVDLLSSDAVKVRKGASVLLDGWGGQHPLEGVVRRVEPYGFTKVSALGIEEQRVNVIIDFTGPKKTWAPLGHGFRVEAHIREWRGEDVLQIPIGALFRDGKDWAVFVDVNGTAKLTKVNIGHTNGRAAEILGGLADGVQVVSYPSDRITNGTDIVAR